MEWWVVKLVGAVFRKLVEWIRGMMPSGSRVAGYGERNELDG